MACTASATTFSSPSTATTIRPASTGASIVARVRTQLLMDTDLFPLRVDETRYLSTTSRERLDGPPLDMYSWLAHDLRDLEIVDIGTGQSTLIVDRVSGVLGFPDEGLVFIDAFGSEPGLWAYPLPYPLARAAELGHRRRATPPTTAQSLLATEEATARQRLAAPE